MANASKVKGNRWTLDFIEKIKRIWPKAHRGMQDRAEVTEADVEQTPGWWIECKVGKKQNPRAALRQAIDDVTRLESDRVPVAVMKDDSEGGGRPAFTFVVMRLDDWIEMVEDYEDLRTQAELATNPGWPAKKPDVW